MNINNEKMTSGQKSGMESSQWGKILTGFIFVATCLLILGFIWQSVAPYVFPE